jgi:hypothetical protein
MKGRGEVKGIKLEAGRLAESQYPTFRHILISSPSLTKYREDVTSGVSNFSWTSTTCSNETAHAGLNQRPTHD